jgi:hypothetical protein
MRLVFALALVAGCIRGGSYHCASSAECVQGSVQGTCEATNTCAFPDSSCASGQRFGDLAGNDSNACVTDTHDAGIDAQGDGHLPDGAGCPVGYISLSGSSHLYRKVTVAAQWMNHRTACTGDGANIYLAIPDDAMELADIGMLAGANAWIGIDDITIEGSYQTVLNAPATFLPWAPGEPDNGGNQDCVELLDATQKIATLTCATQLIAVCECEP